ncbi:MAG: DUF222 domain-containing protein [Actinomycetota bacterium]
MDGPETVSYRDARRPSLVHAVGQLHGVHNAALCQIFAIVAELDRREAFYEDGAKDAASWLEMRLGLSYRTAAKWAEIALALGSLPRLAAAFQSGAISLDKLAACVRFATAETDAYLADEAKTASAEQLERTARRYRTITTEAEAAARKKRTLGWRWTDKGASLTVWGQLTAEQGSTFAKAVERIADSLPIKDEDGIVTRAQRRADALVQLAGTHIANDQDPDRATVIVHADLDTLRSGIGVGETEDGGVLSSDVLRRLVCDSRIQLLVEDGDGNPLGYGRTQRTAPPALMRVLKRRDRVCCFPGCGRTDHLQGHHRTEWPDGGRTDEDDMELYCPVHHAYIHREKIRIVGRPGGELRFFRNDGSEIVAGPRTLDPQVKEWFDAEVFGPLVPPAVDGAERDPMASVAARPP